MKNRFITLFLVIALLGCSLTGCGKQDENQGAEEGGEITEENGSEGKTEVDEDGTSTASKYEGQTLSLMVAKSDSDSEAIKACITAFEQKYGVTVEVEEVPGADEGENILKMRIATNSLPDIVNVSVGAKLIQLDPVETFVDFSGEPFVENIDDDYVKAATVDGGVYAVPLSTSNVAGIYYNKKVYEKLSLEIPETWEAFLQNCAKIKEAGLDSVAAPYESTGLTQIPFLANYYYVQKEIPTFAEDYTANEIVPSETDVFVSGFQKMYDLAVNGYLNEDYLSTSNDVACGMLAEGTAAHMIIRSNILATIDAMYPDYVNDIGFFPIPDKDPEVRGVAKWLPSAYCISKETQNLELAKEFLSFIVSNEAVEAYCSVQKPSGAFMIKGVSLPEDAYPALKEAQSWVDIASTSVMEYSCPIKGANQATICAQVAAGSITPDEAVKQLEDDNKVFAEQLGLENWIN